MGIEIEEIFWINYGQVKMGTWGIGLQVGCRERLMKELSWQWGEFGGLVVTWYKGNVPNLWGETQLKFLAVVDRNLKWPSLVTRLVTTLIVIRETLSSNWWKQMQKSIAKYWAELGKSYRRTVKVVGGGRTMSSQRNQRRQLTWTHRSSQTVEQELRSLRRTDLGFLHKCDRCIAW